MFMGQNILLLLRCQYYIEIKKPNIQDLMQSQSNSQRDFLFGGDGPEFTRRL